MTTSASGWRFCRWKLSRQIALRAGPLPRQNKIWTDIRKHCSEIASDVQSLSHQLHSSTLDYLGVVAAIRAFCNEFSKQHQVSIEFTDRNVPKHLPKDISLCLFRIAQEALHNAVKYSGTRPILRGPLGHRQERFNSSCGTQA